MADEAGVSTDSVIPQLKPFFLKSLSGLRTLKRCSLNFVL